MLKYTPTRNKPVLVAQGSDAYRHSRDNQCISRLFHHTGKRKYEILCSEIHFFSLFSSSYMSYKTYGMFIINTQYM